MFGLANHVWFGLFLFPAKFPITRRDGRSIVANSSEWDENETFNTFWDTGDMNMEHLAFFWLDICVLYTQCTELVPSVLYEAPSFIQTWSLTNAELRTSTLSTTLWGN